MEGVQQLTFCDGEGIPAVTRCCGPRQLTPVGTTTAANFLEQAFLFELLAGGSPRAYLGSAESRLHDGSYAVVPQSW